MLAEALVVAFRRLDSTSVEGEGHEGAGSHPRSAAGVMSEHSHVTGSVVYFDIGSAILGIALDGITCVAMYLRSVAAMRTLVVLHVAHFAATCVFSWTYLAIFRLVVILVIERVR